MKNHTEKQLSRILSRNWTLMLLRGLTAILFGILVWVLPELSVKVLVYLFGAFVLVDGIFGTSVAIVARKEYEDWGILLLWALVGVGVGILTLLVPGLTAMALVYFIAIWAVTTGVLEIVVAIRLRKEIEGEWLLILGGLASVAFGVLLMLQPAVGAIALVWLIGFHAVVFGLLLMTLAFRTRRFVKQLVGEATNDSASSRKGVNQPWIQ
jgi:uncharacterized membrane protein HdeD (DUF308 family)